MKHIQLYEIYNSNILPTGLNKKITSRIQLKNDTEYFLFDEFLNELSYKIFGYENIGKYISHGMEGIVFNLIDSNKVIKIFSSYILNVGHNYSFMRTIYKKQKNKNNPFVNVYEVGKITITDINLKLILDNIYDSYSQTKNNDYYYVIMDKLDTERITSVISEYEKLIPSNSKIWNIIDQMLYGLFPIILQYVYLKRDFEQGYSSDYTDAYEKYEKIIKKSKLDLKIIADIKIFCIKLSNIIDDINDIGDLSEKQVGYYNDEIRVFDIQIDTKVLKYDKKIII